MLVTTAQWFLTINFKDDSVVSKAKVRYTHCYLNVQCSLRAPVVEDQHRSQLLMHVGKMVELCGGGGIEPLRGGP